MNFIKSLCLIFLTALWVLPGTQVVAQDNCFNDFSDQGQRALDSSQFDLAIQSFQSILNNCVINDDQRQEALNLLKSAFDESQNILRELNEIAQEKTRQSDIEAQKAREASVSNELESIKSRANALALNSVYEKNPDSKLVMAYHSRKQIDEIKVFSKSTVTAFNEAVRSRFSFVYDSNSDLVDGVVLVDERILAIAVGKEVHLIASGDSTIIILAHTDYIWSMIPFKDGFITTSKDHLASCWDSQGHKKFDMAGHPSLVLGATISPDQSRILTYGKDGSAILWDDGGNKLSDLIGHKQAILQALFSPDGTRIITRSLDNSVRVWDLSGAELIRTDDDAHVFSAGYNPSSHDMLSASASGKIELANEVEANYYAGNERGVAIFGLRISRDGRHYLTWDAENKVKLWSTDKLIQTFAFDDRVQFADFIPGTHKLVVATGPSLKSYDFAGNEIFDITEEAPISVAKVSEDGNYILTGSNTLTLWSHSGTKILGLDGFRDELLDLGFSQSGSHFSGYSRDGVVAMCRIPQVVYEEMKQNPPVLTQDLIARYDLEPIEMSPELKARLSQD